MRHSSFSNLLLLIWWWKQTRTSRQIPTPLLQGSCRWPTQPHLVPAPAVVLDSLAPVPAPAVVLDSLAPVPAPAVVLDSLAPVPAPAVVLDSLAPVPAPAVVLDSLAPVPAPAVVPDSSAPVSVPEAVPPVSVPEAVPPVSVPEAVPTVSVPEAVPPVSVPEAVPPVSVPEAVPPVSVPVAVPPVSVPLPEAILDAPQIPSVQSRERPSGQCARSRVRFRVRPPELSFWSARSPGRPPELSRRSGRLLNCLTGLTDLVPKTPEPRLCVAWALLRAPSAHPVLGSGCCGCEHLGSVPRGGGSVRNRAGKVFFPSPVGADWHSERTPAARQPHQEESLKSGGCELLGVGLSCNIG
ncbi:uncharacterized protein LOC133418490 isoform X2 [Cololabis saira]|nr:uncharacterized protein LOC133418490 isoform X2 [Cololabis saira]